MSAQTDQRSCRPWLHGVVAFLALAGLADSIYLTITHLTGEDVVCIAVSGCSEVLSSSYSSVGPIPLGALGVLGYFLAFSFAILAAFGNAWTRILLRFQVAGMFAATLWLLYVQAFILHAFCTYCLLSAALTVSMTMIVVLIYFLGKRHRMTGQPASFAGS